jgi:NADPH:quinone reductase
MKAIEISETGGTEVLQIVEKPMPVPRAGQVLIKVEAVGLNFADILTVRGTYLARTRLPMIPGMEFAGIVTELGAGVSGYQLGQRVAVLAGAGGMAEYAAVPAQTLVPVPQTLSATQAAAFAVSYFTAYFALTALGHAKAGETLLVQAAGGALGTAAVQLAKALGLRVIACASRQEKLDVALGLGAEVGLLSDAPDLAAQVRAACGGKDHGPDLIFEVTGGESLNLSLQMLGAGGRCLLIGLASLEPTSVRQGDLLNMMRRNQSLTGVWLTPLVQNAALMAEARAFIEPLLVSGAIQPIVGRTFSLEEAGAAFDWVMSRNSSGKVVICP